MRKTTLRTRPYRSRQRRPWGTWLGVLLTAIFLLAILASCSLLEEPQRPEIIVPTPVSTSVPLSFDASDVVVDPVSNIVPNVNTDVATLVNAVSTQQLEAYVRTLEGFGTRNSYSDTTRPDWGIGAARQWIFAEFDRVGGGRLQVRFQDFPMNYDGLITNQQNVVATLPGTSPHAGVVVLMAHYDSRPAGISDGDSRAPGADDNASGVAAMMEIARLLSARTWNQTVIFVAMAAEEQGTFGSRFFVQNALLNEGMEIDAAISMDGVGGRAGIPQSIRLFAVGPSDSNHQQFARFYEYMSGMYVPTFPVTMIEALDREGRWGDHREFVNAGITAIRLTESQEDESIQNSTRDTWSLIDYNYLQQVTQMNLAVIANIIGGPPRPTAPVIAPMADPGAYILNWPVDNLAAGYALSFRPVGQREYAPFYFVNASQAGTVAITGLDPNQTFAVSIAGVDATGRLGLFSPEIILRPEP